MAEAAEALDLSCFAYLALPRRPQERPGLISTYPTGWTSHYLRSRYQCIDPVIVRALQTVEPFRWGAELASKSTSAAQQKLFDEAAQFGIRFGFTVPIHDGHEPVAALTFATDRRQGRFEDCINAHARVLQLMGMLFHVHVRRKVARNVDINQGKSAWEIGRILGISQYTAASYLNNAKKKLGVRTVVQAAIQLMACKKG